MKSHATMNRIYRLIWSHLLNAWVAVAENARGQAKGKGTRRKLAAVALSLSTAVAYAGPLGGQVASGSGSISQSGSTTTIQQSSQNLSLNWQSFNVAPQETVNFAQPSASAIAVNRIFDINGSQILGHLNANGQVYLINQNGILFGQGAQVNVGGLVASTLDLTAQSGNTKTFSGNGTGSIVNQGTLNATNGGYVALLGNQVSNQGVISAQLGSVALGAGSAATLTFNGNSLLHMQVDQSTLNNLAENRQLIHADGGQVIMTAGAKDALLASVVNNSGIIEARTVENHEGVITLLGGMKAGTANIGGTLDASAPNGGNGGFIETSAAKVTVANDARVTTVAATGNYGSWLIDPQNYTVAASGGDITGAALSTNLGTTPITLQSSSGGTAGSGNVNINDAVTWSANTTLTLTASNNVNINANLTATGNTAGLVLNPNTANGAEAASGSGTYSLANGASITLSGLNPGLSIGGTSYTVINNLGVAGDTSGTTLQGINGGLTGHYALGSNIDASSTSGWNSGAGFTPIGTNNTPLPFTGTFDGLGHTISGLTINTPSSNYVGLFGCLIGGMLKNVGMLGDSVSGSIAVGGLVGWNYLGTISNAYATGSVSGGGYVGGLAGWNYSGTISNAYATGNASGTSAVGGLVGWNDHGTISNAYATGSVYGASGEVGGLVGWSDSGTISNAYATGNVSGPSYVGGLVGLSGGSGTISNAYATGSVSGRELGIGGLVGYNNGTISNAYASGSVSGNQDVGGLVGYNSNGMISNSYATGSVSISNVASANEILYFGGLVGGNDHGTIDNSYATGGVVGSSYVGGLVGENSGLISNSYATGSVTGSLEVGGLVGCNCGGTLSNAFYNVDHVSINGGQKLTAGGIYNGQFQDWIGHGQTLNIANYSSLPAGSGGYRSVSSVQGMKDMLGFVENPAFNFRLTTNINLSSAPGFYIPYFSGAFDGNNNVISNLLVNFPDNSAIGMFGQLFGSVSNLGVVNASIAGNSYVGGLVGLNNFGTVSNSYATGSISGNTGVGGLVGFSFGGAVSNSYATGSVSGNTGVGGLVGLNNTNVNNSYATGSVTGSSGVGGLVGSNGGILSNSFWNSDINAIGIGDGTTTGATGMITAQMQTQANFTSATLANGNVNPAWDFANTWVMYDGHTTPLLRSFMTPLTVTANNAVKTYDGQAWSGGNGVTYSRTPNSNLLGTVSYRGTSQGAINASSYVITPGGLYSNQQGYIIGYANGTLIVNPATITVTGTTLTVTGTVANDKVYDGTTTATLTGGALVGVIPGDSLTLNQSGYFATKNVGTNIAVTATDSLGGSAQGNYILIQPTGLAANITPALLTVIGTTAGNKVYDGTTTATLAGGTLNGVIAGDNITLNQSGMFATKNAGTNIAVTATDSLGGSAQGNYTLTQPTGLAANITPKPITVAATGVDKVYDGNINDPATLSSAGVVSGDTLTLAYASATFNNKDVGTNKPVSVSGINATGADAGNYTLNSTASTMASITQQASDGHGDSNNGSSDHGTPTQDAHNAATQVQSSVSSLHEDTHHDDSRQSSPMTGSHDSGGDGNAGGDTSSSPSGQGAQANTVVRIGETGGTLRIENGGVNLPVKITNLNLDDRS